MRPLLASSGSLGGSFFGRCFSPVPQPQQPADTHEPRHAGFFSRFFFVESSRTQPKPTDRHRTSPLRAHFNTPPERKQPPFRPLPPRNCGLWLPVGQAKPGLGSVGVSKPRLVIFELDPARELVNLSYGETKDRRPSWALGTYFPRHETFFSYNFSPWNFYVGSCGIALNSTTRRHPRLGFLVVGSRGPTQIHIRGLRHWVGEAASEAARAAVNIPKATRGTMPLIGAVRNLPEVPASCQSRLVDRLDAGESGDSPSRRDRRRVRRHATFGTRWLNSELRFEIWSPRLQRRR